MEEVKARKECKGGAVQEGKDRGRCIREKQEKCDVGKKVKEMV